MYDDVPNVLANRVGRNVPRFPTENIKSPIALFWGGRDTLLDMDYLLDHVGRPEFVICVEEFENLHFLWYFLLFLKF